jgi:hypothetical protein
VPKNIKVVAIDCGIKGGFAFKDQQCTEADRFDFGKEQTLWGYEKRCKDLLTLYKPDIVVTGRPCRFYQTLIKHAALQAIIELACEKKGVQFMKISDSAAKKNVFGKGKVEKKEIMERYKVGDDNVADAMMFAEYIYNIAE